MKSNVLTIIKKEFDRVFRDRQLMFTTVLLPGLIIYFVYSFIGMGATRMIEANKSENILIQVDNMPQSLAASFETFGDNVTLEEKSFGQTEINALKDKNINVLLVRFPAQFDELVSAYSPSDSIAAPNVEVYYNSANDVAQNMFSAIRGKLTSYEESISNRFDINRIDSPEVRFNQADEDQVSGQILGRILPLMILMMLFSGVMAVAQSSIAGEKERGTIATLLVTPLKRNELALGKIVAVSGVSLLSALSSFAGIVLSLPQFMMSQGGSANMSFQYTTADYIILLLIIISTVLVVAAIVSILSTIAKDTKNAASLCMPLMFVMMFAGIICMFQNGPIDDTLMYLIPFYNATSAMTALLQHELVLTNAIVAIGANIVYASVAVWGLAKMFNSERIMFRR
ncbi:MAG: ABC transporter permease [Bacteroidales bacterium]|nr:ABC transporter permease [Bacteroidales bacterium]